MKRRSDLIAAVPSPGIRSGAEAASQTDTPTLAEWATIRESEV